MVQLNRQYDRADNSGEPVHVKVVGIGGAGSNILDRVMLDGIEAADLVAINTDVQSLTASVAAHKVQLGRNLTRGLGLLEEAEFTARRDAESTTSVPRSNRAGCSQTVSARTTTASVCDFPT